MALLIIKARDRLTTLAGVDFNLICLPVINVYLQWLLQQSDTFQMALTNFSGQLSSHPPKHKLVTTSYNLPMQPKRSEVLLQALTVFTDGSSRTHKSVLLWWDDDFKPWNSDVTTVSRSPQIAELAAVVRAFKDLLPLSI